MTRDQVNQALNRAFEKLTSSLSNLNDAQMVYLLGVVDGMEGSSAALAAIAAATTMPDDSNAVITMKEAQ